MKHRSKLLLATLLIVSATGGAALVRAALSHAHAVYSQAPRTPGNLPRAVSFREIRGRGLVTRVWINGLGPYDFAIDTGAGATFVSPRVADAARLPRAGAISLQGLSGRRSTAHRTTIGRLAVGDEENYFPAKGKAMITGTLPADLDGILDPTEALSPLGYTIDIPLRELVPFDPAIDPLQTNRVPHEGAVVPWLREAHGNRPFVRLNNGDRALLDTGSGLGLAIRASGTETEGPVRIFRDASGAEMSSRRVTTSNIAIGSLVLQRIPTDLVSGSEADAPVLLGLTALRPFRMRFDPLHRLIEIAPSTVSGRD